MYTTIISTIIVYNLRYLSTYSRLTLVTIIVCATQWNYQISQRRSAVTQTEILYSISVEKCQMLTESPSPSFVIYLKRFHSLVYCPKFHIYYLILQLSPNIINLKVCEHGCTYGFYSFTKTLLNNFR